MSLDEPIAYHSEDDDLEAFYVTARSVSENIAALTSSLDEYSDILLDYPLQRLQDTLQHFAHSIHILPEKLEERIERSHKQPTLFNFENTQLKRQEMEALLAEKSATCAAQSCEISLLKEKLDRLEKEHHALRIKADAATKKLDNIIDSFDATLGS